MGIFDKLQAMFKSDKVDINMRFELLSEGIMGTMSKFHKARDRDFNRIVGLKVCDIEKTDLFENRFKELKKPSEGEISKAMQHERIVETYEYGTTTKGQHYIVMEYLEGPGLHLLIRQQDERVVGRRIPLIRQMAEALRFVHQAGYIHRDVCPRNFICAEDLKSLKLIDFGLTLPDKAAFRQPGNRTGLPTYMAPEIVRRRPTDRRVDIFAFGVTCYHLLTYDLPWPSGDVTGKSALAHDTHDPTPILELYPQLNKRVASAIMECVSADPNARPKDLTAFIKRIHGVKGETDP